MPQNIGSVDKIIRIVLGVAMIAFALVGPETGYNWLGFIGVVPILTAVINFCPLYVPLGIKTRSDA